METPEKLAERLGLHASFEAKHKQGGYDQAEKPGTAYLCFPQRRLRVAVAALNRLKVTMYAAFGKSDALCRCRTLCCPYSRIALKMRTLLDHNPMVSVRALKGG
jgi:hypothetical protein